MVKSVAGFERILYGMGFARNKHITQKEMVYDLPVDNWLLIRVYSSIPKFASLLYQKDTIRIKIVEASTERFIYSRTIDNTEWEDIEGVIMTVVRDAKRFRPCKCGGILVVKPGVRGKFLGCTNFPRCKEKKELPIL